MSQSPAGPSDCSTLCFWGGTEGPDDPDEPLLSLLPHSLPIGSGAPFRLGFQSSYPGGVFGSVQAVPEFSPGSAVPPVGWHPTLSLPGALCAPSVHGNHHQPCSWLTLPAWSWSYSSTWACLVSRTPGGTWLPSLPCPALLPQAAQGWSLPWQCWLCLAPCSLGSSWDLLLGDIFWWEWKPEPENSFSTWAVLQPSGEEVGGLAFMISLHIQKWGYLNEFICGLARLAY